jgi:hypothetical protein
LRHAALDDHEQLAVAGIIAAARDHGRSSNCRPSASARSLRGQNQGRPRRCQGGFCVAGMGSVPADLSTLAQFIADAHPTEPSIANRFRLQQLAGAGD